jgi:DNA mismatch repair protein MutS
MALVKKYLDLTSKSQKEYGDLTVVLMQCGSFYEVYALCEGEGDYSGSPISDVSRICDLHIASKSASVNGKPVVMAGFGLTVLDKYVRKLQEAGYTIVVYDQDTQTSNTTRSQREVVSPGTYFSTDNVSSLSNNLVCISLAKGRAMTGRKDHYVIVGVAHLDIFTGKSSAIQVQKTYYRDSSTYDDLERHISVFAPSECIITGNVEESELRQVVGYVGLSGAKCHYIASDSSEGLIKHDYVKNAAKQKYQMETLRRAFPRMPEECMVEALKSHDVALGAYVLLLGFATMHNPSLTSLLSFPEFENHTDRLLLGTHSLRQLNIIDDKRHMGTLRSVSDFLNRCVTNMGRREFFHKFVSPLTNPDKINQAYSVTDSLISDGSYKTFRSKLTGLVDVDRFQRKLVRGQASPKDIAFLYDTLRATEVLAEMAGENQPLSSVLDAAAAHLASRNLADMIQAAFDVDKCRAISSASADGLGTLDPSDANFLVAGVCPQVDSLCQESSQAGAALDSIKDALSDVIIAKESRATKSSMVKIHDTPKMPPCLLCTSRRAAILKSEVSKPGWSLSVPYNTSDGNPMVIDGKSVTYSPQGGSKKDTSIGSPEINHLCESLQSSRQRMIDEIVLFYRKFTSELSDSSANLVTVSRFLADMDVAQNRAHVAETYNYVKPTVMHADSAFFEAQGLRHPLVEHLQTREIYVTNDLAMGAGEQSGILLYGTNAVGKTCLIRAIGIAIIMAQAGLYVPAESFAFAPYRKIFTRIVGNDDIFKGLSTFAVEMSELRTILESSDQHSLVLGDELCSGTESGSARSIFMAGIEWLARAESTFLFATHFHEINEYPELAALDSVAMKHMEVRYDQATNSLVYDRKLKDGPGFSSYGLEVCKALNLPDEFLVRAHELRREYTPDTKAVSEMAASRYNASKIRGNCERCGKAGAEIHHLKHQAGADKRGYVGGHHKNHPANLMNVCEGCHDALHAEGGQHRRVKTSSGYQLQRI